MAKLREKRVTVYQIAKILEEKGIKTKTGKKNWSIGSIKRAIDRFRKEMDSKQNA